MKQTTFILLIACKLLVLSVAPFSANADVVTVWGDEIGKGVVPGPQEDINDFYNSLDGQQSSIAEDTYLSSVDLSHTDLLWVTQPANAYNPEELTAMADFIAGGGRIAFLGEHGDIAAEENAYITEALSYLGSTISINDGALDYDKIASVANGQISEHPLTRGVTTFFYSVFAPMSVSGTAQILMTGEEPYNGSTSSMMTYQDIGAGSVFVITDQNVWDGAEKAWSGIYADADNARLFEHLLTTASAEGAPPEVDPVYVQTHSSTVTIHWTYSDPDGDVQQQYEVEVWTGPDQTGTRIWDAPLGMGPEDSLRYTGPQLTDGTIYYARVRVHDGTGWGEFSGVRFRGVSTQIPTHPLRPLVRETGYISLSVDACADTADGVYIQVDKPENAVVRSAYLATADCPLNDPIDAVVVLEGAQVVWEHTIQAAINKHRNYWAEVTDLVKATIDSSPAGRINLQIIEQDNGNIDGEILAVIFDDPNQTIQNTVVLFFGTQQQSGDDLYIGYSEPINLSVPDFRLDLSLGISFSNHNNDASNRRISQQYSIIDVNGKRLTTSAGGQDDGDVGIGNGSGRLITVGGIGDTNTNPADPDILPEYYRDDDELYSLIPFVTQGDTLTHVFTKNPSNDDNIFFGALFMSATALVGEGILLSRVVDTITVGMKDTLSAMIQDESGTPVPGRMITFEIVNGPHAGLKDSSVTGSSGIALFTYTGETAGADEIVATLRDADGSLKSSNHVWHHWTDTAGTHLTVADAGSDQTVHINAACSASVMLDGTGSSAADGGSIVSYTWATIAGTVATGATADVTLPIGVHPIVVTVVDDKGAMDSDTITITVINRVPVLSVVPDTIIDKGLSLQLFFTASDSDATVPRIHASGLPAGAVFSDSGNGVASLLWHTGCNDHGVYTITIAAVDCSDSATQSFILTVRDVDDAFGFIPVNDTVVAPEHTVSLTIPTRFCGSQAPALRAIVIPATAACTDNGNGTALFEWTPSAVDSGEHSLVIEATNGATGIYDTIRIHVVGGSTVLPELTGGYYVDENSDGMVDAAYLRFTEVIPIDSITVTLSRPGTSEPEMDAVSKAYLSYGTDHTIVRASVPQVSQQAYGIRTSGRMSATVQFSSFMDNTMTTELADSAAPVIDSAICRLGDRWLIDTFHVWFSEPVKLGTATAPFTLLREGTLPFSPLMELYTFNTDYAVFIMQSVDSTTIPKKSDSVFVNPISAVGDSMNWQNNPDNRRVQLQWEPGGAVVVVPMRTSENNPMDISGICTQFGISEHSGILIAINTREPFDTLRQNDQLVMDEKDGNITFGTAMIYDAVGNVVKNKLYIKNADVGRIYYVVWDGTNRSNRRVAQGTYLIAISYAIDSKSDRRSGKCIVRWR